jgi:hypothetical protein
MHAQMADKDNKITKVGPALSSSGDFASYMENSYDDQDFEQQRRAEKKAH